MTSYVLVFLVFAGGFIIGALTLFAGMAYSAKKPGEHSLKDQKWFAEQLRRESLQK